MSSVNLDARVTIDRTDVTTFDSRIFEASAKLLRRHKHLHWQVFKLGNICQRSYNCERRLGVSNIILNDQAWSMTGLAISFLDTQASCQVYVY